MKNIKDKIELFKKITEAHFATDYSSIDYLYPPLFIWNKVRRGSKIQNGSIFSRLLPGAYTLYAHFPFCRYKCTFCRQFSLASRERYLYRNYVDLLIKELKLYAPYFRDSQLTGIYFGGGTPTLFDLEKVLKEIYRNFKFTSPFYLNIESTPDSLDRKKLLTLKHLGLTRLLIGVQSLDPKVLKAIGRPVDQLPVFQKIYKQARAVGIPYINVELVCGLPQQIFESFIKDLKHIISLKPESIHIYPFMQTPLTILGKNKGSLKPSQVALMQKMHNEGLRILNDTGYFYRGDDFALSNTGRNPNYYPYAGFSRHMGVLAVGMSSLGFYAFPKFYKLRTFNTLNLKKYAQMISQNLFPIEKFYYLNSDETLRMSLMRAYRYGYLLESDFKIKTGLSLEEIHSRYKKEFSFLRKIGKIRINESFSQIDFDTSDWLIYSKIFYSPKVLKECRQIINSKKFQNLPI